MPRYKNASVTTLVTFFALFAGLPVLAHRGHDDAVRLVRSENGIQVSFHINSGTLKVFDDNGDDRLSRAEFEANRDQIADHIDACLAAQNDAGQAIEPSMRDHPISGYAALQKQDEIMNIRVVRRYSNQSGLARLDLSCFPPTHDHRSVLSVALSQAEFGTAIRQTQTLLIKP